MASTIASSDSVLIEKPNTSIMPNAPISDTGIVTSGTSTARQFRRNRKITIITRTIASATVMYTSSIEYWMKRVVSKAFDSSTPSGRVR